MRTWKSRLFGDDRLNFYSAIVMGVVVIGWSSRCLLRAVDEGAMNSSTGLLLAGIQVLLLGHLAVTLTTYTSRLAKRLDGVKDDGADELSS